MNEFPGENTQREPRVDETEEQATIRPEDVAGGSGSDATPADEPVAEAQEDPEQESAPVPPKGDMPSSPSVQDHTPESAPTREPDRDDVTPVDADAETAIPVDVDAATPEDSVPEESAGMSVDADSEHVEPEDTNAQECAPHDEANGEDATAHEAETPYGEVHEGDGEHAADGEPHRPRIILKAGTDPESIRALELCQEKVAQLHLKMHPLAARWDGEKHVTIFFRADEKVDFRKLVRELSRVLRARIELRQLGPREQGKLCGLVGKCGQPLCCQTFLSEFTQSSIKMAKTQDLALNPMKISGVCGRLLCCLNYEQEMYAEVKSRMPKVNKWVETEFGPGKVTAVNVLKETVTVQLETATRELSLDQVRLSEAPSQS